MSVSKFDKLVEQSQDQESEIKGLRDQVYLMKEIIREAMPLVRRGIQDMAIEEPWMHELLQRMKEVL